MPDTAVLIGAAIAYLEHELIPTLTGYHRFQSRVSVTVLRIVERELTLAARQAADERERLVALLGHAAPLDALNDELVAKIRAGALASDDIAVRDHVRATLAEALAINNPRWLAR